MSPTEAVEVGSDVRTWAFELIQSFPADCTWEQLLYRLWDHQQQYSSFLAAAVNGEHAPVVLPGEEIELKRSPKGRALLVVSCLSQGATWDQMLYKLWSRKEIDEGLEDIRAGRVISHEEMLRSLDIDDKQA